MCFGFVIPGIVGDPESDARSQVSSHLWVFMGWDQVGIHAIPVMKISSVHNFENKFYAVGNNGWKMISPQVLFQHVLLMLQEINLFQQFDTIGADAVVGGNRPFQKFEEPKP